ncbi:single-stranded DNA-binding protein [Blastococcus sp. SYSU D00820]
MNETEVTVVGNVVDSPRQSRTEKGNVTNFRVASNSRRYDASVGGFVDGPTLFIDVAAWNALGGNVAHSISKGDEVIVKGLLATDSWETENGRRSQTRIKAIAVGPNLQRGWATFHRPQRAAQPAGEPPAGPFDDHAPAPPFDDTRFDADDVTPEFAPAHAEDAATSALPAHH